MTFPALQFQKGEVGGGRSEVDAKIQQNCSINMAKQVEKQVQHLAAGPLPVP